MLECFDTLHRSFGQSLDAAVVQDLDVSDDLMACRRALRKETKADALHVAANKKSSRDLVRHHY